jgi:predicted Zn-dependent protease
VQPFSEMTYWSALAYARLGQKAESKRLLKGLLAHAEALAWKPAVIDYFATSLPAMLLFEEDLAFQQETAARFLEAQARLGLGQEAHARQLLLEVLRREPSHALAQDLLPERGR